MKTIKHDHLLTKLLKVFIFSLMILLPFMIWLPNAFYYGFNETAQAQTKTQLGPIYYETNEVNEIGDIFVGKIYHWNDNYESEGPQTNNLALFHCSYVSTIENVATNMYFFLNTSGNMTLSYNINGVQYTNFNAVECDFIIDQLYNSFNTAPIGLLSKISSSDKKVIKEYGQVEYSMSITESMSEAWQQVWDNRLMTWTNNSILKTPIDNFIGVFAINNDACISNYLIYLITLTGIYVVIDIVLELFIALTHIFSGETKK